MNFSKKGPVLVVSFCLLIASFCKNDTPTGPENEDVQIVAGGIITLDGDPFVNVDVYLTWGTSKKTITRADGKFSFGSLAPGSYIVTPSKQGYTFSPSHYELNSTVDMDFKAQSAEYGEKEGDTAADFTAKDKDGQKVSLYDFFGRVVLVNFSADWCGPCREEAPKLEALYQKYKSKGLRIISLQISGSPADWVRDYSLTFPVLDDTLEKIWAIYGEGYIPLNIILDRNCTIRYKNAGFDESQVEATIQQHL